MKQQQKAFFPRLFVALFLILQACSSASGDGSQATPQARTQGAQLATATAQPAVQVSPSSSPTTPPTETPLPSATVVPSATLFPLPDPTPNPAEPYRVYYHPDGGLMVGDMVSMEVVAPSGEDMRNKQVQIQVDTPGGPTFGPVDFGPYGIAGRTEAVFTWVWDTANQDAGNYTLTYSVLPDGATWTDSVTLAPVDTVLSQQKWETLTTDCCSLNYITGTDAARDIEDLADLADEQAQKATERLQVDFTEPITVTLLPRVLGHGGFAGEEIYVTYSDTNYMGSRFDMVLHHEMIHILDGKLGGDYRPSIFIEGLAVYLTGGHFKPTEIFPRAAALLDLETDGKSWYIPLDELANDFYTAQHEIGYLEGAALIQYMVNRWGWEAFDDFYRTMKPVDGGTTVDAIDAALKDKFGVAFDELEASFLEALRNQEVSPEARADLELTVLYYNTARRYQLLFDPSAYFATAWLPDGPSMRERGITADFTRHPHDPANQEFESMLIEASDALLADHYDQVRGLLEEINRGLDAASSQGY